jgi:predicted signal transduction protein with EAL and GGDEF domain
MVASFRVLYENRELAVTMSFGIACLDPSEPLPKKELIRRADVALYAAKDKGKNRICLYQEDPEVKNRDAVPAEALRGPLPPAHPREATRR